MRGPIGNNFGQPIFPVNLHQGLYYWARGPIGSNWSNWLKAEPDGRMTRNKTFILVTNFGIFTGYGVVCHHHDCRNPRWIVMYIPLVWHPIQLIYFCAEVSSNIHSFVYSKVNTGKSVYIFCSWCDGSSDRWWTHWAISRSSKCSTTGVTMAVICAILSVGWLI